MPENRTRDALILALQRHFEIDDYLELRRRFPTEDMALWMVMASDIGLRPTGWISLFNWRKIFRNWEYQSKLY